MKGNFHVRFLEGKAVAIPPTHSIGGTDIAVVYDRLAAIISKRMPVHINYNMVAEASIHLNENVGIYCIGIPNIIIH